jgi:hypothetical protein
MMRVFPPLDFRLGSWFGEDKSPVLEFRGERIHVDQFCLRMIKTGEPLA